MAAGLVGLVCLPRCYLCGRALDELDPLCPECLARLPRRRGPRCQVCGRPLQAEADLCADCAVEVRPYARAVALGPYEGELRTVVRALKYEGERALARTLGDLLADLAAVEWGGRPPESRPVVTWVPADPARLRQRGYHAAQLLALRAARGLALSARGLLVKLRPTPPQVGRSLRERRGALAGAFAARAEGEGEPVVLVDDVMTSGETVEQAARALGEAGFGDVHVLVCARGGGESEVR
ncbi:MAG: ComF family protein [Candidatus Bipolaricaulaceae bacterium]